MYFYVMEFLLEVLYLYGTLLFYSKMRLLWNKREENSFEFYLVVLCLFTKVNVVKKKLMSSLAWWEGFYQRRGCPRLTIITLKRDRSYYSQVS